jgi:hypothetical protein
MSDLLGTPSDASAARELEEPLRLLYVSGPAPEIDFATIRQLEACGAEVTRVDSLRTAVAEIRAARATVGFHALLTSPTTSGEETINLIARWHLGHAPVPIVPILTEANHRLCTDAVAAGAQAVLLLVKGVLAHPDETLERFRHGSLAGPDGREAAGGGALRRLRGLFDGGAAAQRGGYRTSRGQHAAVEQVRLQTKARLEEAYVARVRTETHVDQEPLELPPVGYAQADDTDRDARTASGLPPPGGDDHHDADDHQADIVTSTGDEDEDPQDEARAADAALQHVLDTEGADQDGWDSVRQVLEARIAELETAARGHADASAALATAQNDLQAAQAAAERHAAERAAWDEARRALEAHVAELETAARAQADVEAALTAVREALQTSARQHAADRAMWNATRESLEARVAELQSAIDSRGGAADPQAPVPAAVPEPSDAQETGRAAWETTRQTLEQRIRDLWASEHERQRLRDVLLDSRAQYAKLEGEYQRLIAKLAEATTRIQQPAAETSHAQLDPVSAHHDHRA